MMRKGKTNRVLPWILVLTLLLLPLSGAAGAPSADPPTQEEVKQAIARGVEWLAGQQHPAGYWGGYELCSVTALAVKKLEHHAIDPTWGYGLPSPFDEAYPYREHVERGLNWLLENCSGVMAIGVQPAGDPDSDGDGFGVYWGTWYRTYTSGIMLMTLCEAVELDRVVENGPLASWTYEDIARDTMDYLAFGQNDAGGLRGGWGYQENQIWSDNSNSGYATLGLGFAEIGWPRGCGFEIPPFVKAELDIWIDYIQNDVDGDTNDGGSGYADPYSWVNILKTGNLLQQMSLVGDTADSARVQDALDYMARHWGDPNQDPGWRNGPSTSSYQATFTAMKGFTSLGIHEFGDPVIDWQEDFETELLAEQLTDGSWDYCNWGDRTLCTTWALLTLQKVAPPFPVPLDIKPQSCRNPLNPGSQGVLPVAILGTDKFDVEEVDPATVLLMGVSPVRWELEDVATPFEPYLGKQDAFNCTDEGPDGYMDLTLKFDLQAIVAALGDVERGDVLVLQLSGLLHDGTPFIGEDVVVIVGGKK
ncbi:MAG: hypothetical protein PVF70_11210 [Anaerolineales bacterium]